MSWGVEGLIKAKKNYVEGKGTQFKTYAYYRIRGEMLDSIRREWNYRNPTDYRRQQAKIQERIAEVAKEALDQEDGKGLTDAQRNQKINDIISNSAVVYLISLDDAESVVSDSPTNDPAVQVLDEMAYEHDHNALLEELESLDPEERRVVELFYFKNMKQKEIAEKLKLSRSKVCRLHMKVLSKLKRRLERRFLDDGAAYVD